MNQRRIMTRLSKRKKTQIWIRSWLTLLALSLSTKRTPNGLSGKARQWTICLRRTMYSPSWATEAPTSSGLETTPSRGLAWSRTILSQPWPALTMIMERTLWLWAKTCVLQLISTSRRCSSKETSPKKPQRSSSSTSTASRLAVHSRTKEEPWLPSSIKRRKPWMS